MCLPVYPLDAALIASVCLPLSIFFYFYFTTYQVTRKESTLISVVVCLVIYIVGINLVIYAAWDSYLWEIGWYSQSCFPSLPL